MQKTHKKSHNLYKKKEITYNNNNNNNSNNNNNNNNNCYSNDKYIYNALKTIESIASKMRALILL